MHSTSRFVGFVSGVILVCLAVPADALSSEGAGAAGDRQEPGLVERHLVFEDENLDFELRRALGYAVSGGADLNECLLAARRIDESDRESWWDSWFRLGETVRGWGEHSLSAGNRVSARAAFLRASNYYRVAEFFLHGNPEDPRIDRTWRLSREMFRSAAKLLEHPVEILAIPYQTTRLPGYFLAPDDTGKPRKTLIAMTGFDGTGEELYFSTAFFALERGYNVLIFEGPGQGGALREQGLVFRPDWENVVTPVVDYALTRADVDPERIALMGASMGGYLAPRAAAFEHRIAALVANPGAVDLRGRGFPDDQELADMNEDPEETNAAVRKRMDQDTGFRWWVENGMFTTGTTTPLEFMNAWTRYTLAGLVDRIEAPSLIIQSQGDIFFTRESQKALYDELDSPKTLLVFEQDGVAPSHVQAGAKSEGNRRILDWLDRALAGR